MHRYRDTHKPAERNTQIQRETRIHTQIQMHTNRVTQICVYSPPTISKSKRTSFSDSPRYLDVSVDEDTLKKVVLHSVATALASRVLPVPGGPTMRTPWGKEGSEVRGQGVGGEPFSAAAPSRAS